MKEPHPQNISLHGQNSEAAYNTDKNHVMLHQTIILFLTFNFLVTADIIIGFCLNKDNR